MGYVRTTLVYGTTVSEEQFSEIKKKIIKLVQEDEDEDEDYDEDYDYELMDILGIVYNHGYYHSEYKIGIEIEHEDSDIRTGQDFNYDFNIYTKEELEKKAFNKKETFDKIGIDIAEFSLGICVYNY